MAWELFRRETNDGLEMIGVDSDLLTDAPVPELPVAVEITIEAPSTLPEFIGSAEATMDAVTDRLGGRIAGTARISHRLWVLVHLPSDERASEYTRLPLPNAASVSVAPANDPQWTLFDRVRPEGIEEQSMVDLRKMAELHAAGDVGGQRDVEHLVSAIAPDRREPFVAAVSSVIDDLQADVSGDGEITLRHRADPADITAETWTIRQIAERHGARYDGWAASVVAAESRPKRSWFGRR